MVPVVTTSAVTDITAETAECGGTIVDDGGSDVTEYGICYGTEVNPTVSGTHIECESEEASFTAVMTGLLSETKYYVRAYATNAAGTGYGEQIEFMPASDPELNIQDETFKSWLLSHIDADSDGKIRKSEALVVDKIDVSEMSISSFEGIKEFVNLTEFVASGTQATSVDVSGMTKLTRFICNGCPSLTTVSLDGCTSLVAVEAYGNALSSISIADCMALVHFYVFKNSLKSVDLSDCSELQYMNISENQLESLDVTANTKLVELFANNGKYESLDVSDHTALTKLDVAFNADLTTVNVSGCEALAYFYAQQTSIVKYDMRGLANLLEFFAYDSKAPIEETLFDGCEKLYHIQYGMSLANTEVTISNLPSLKTLIVWGTNMTKLTISSLPALELLNVDVTPTLAELSITDCPNIKTAQMAMVGLSSMDFSPYKNLELMQIQNSSALKSLTLDNPKLTTVRVHENTGISSLDISRCSMNMVEVNADNENIRTITMKTGQTVDNFSKKEGVTVNYVD